jgi:pimeloyl-ACP methyl ester carboxylesterase
MNVSVRNKLEKQFSRRRVVKFNKAKINIVNIMPPRLKTRVPLVVVSGWASTAAVLKENILALAATGRRVIYADAPHGIPALGRPGYPAAQLRKAAALLLLIDASGVRSADVIAHSEGAIVAAIAAALQPKKFRNIILVNPAGLSKKKPLAKLAADFSADVLWGELNRILAEPALARTVLTAWLEAGRAIAADPFKSWEEAQAISVSEIAGMLKELEAKGIGVAVIHASGDRAFPAREVCANARAGKKCKVITLPGSHYEFYFKPAEFAQMADKILTSFESGSKKLKSFSPRLIRLRRK